MRSERRILPVAKRWGGGPRQTGAVEGPLPRSQNHPNQPVHHRLDILQHIHRRHPNHNKPPPPEPFIPHRIALHPKIMRHPIHLDDHLRLGRVKIRHINPDRMLPPKLHPTRPQAQPLPQQHLRRRHLPPQPPRPPNRRLSSLPHPTLPPKSSLWRSHGEVAAAKRLTEGPSAQRSLRSPPLHHPTGGPPPHRYATGRKSKPQPPPPRTNPQTKSSQCRRHGEGDHSRSEWWRG